jgi:glycosyltransferase involved in cell wall biosynthesis
MLNLAELRGRSFPKMLAYLRSIRADSVFLPIEDENGAVILPILKIIASVIPAKKFIQIDANMQAVRFTRVDVALSAFHLATASVACRLAVERARREATRLLAAERVRPAASASRSILFLNANLWFGVKAGGSVGHISGVVNGFLAQGREVEFATAGGRLLVSANAELLPLRPPERFGVPWESNMYRFHRAVVGQMTAVLQKRRPALLYQRLSLANYSGVELSRRFALPLVIEYNGSEAWIARNWGRPLREHKLAEQIEQVNLRHAHLVVTISNVLRDELLERGVPPERIVAYPNCIDPDMFDPSRFAPEATADLRRKLGIEADATVVTFVGTFGQWHGAEVLAQAIRDLLDQGETFLSRRKPHFLFVGDGLRTPEVRSILGGHVGAGHVTLAGLVPQAETPLYLAASDILASPHVPNDDGSRFFGSPTKLYEYMAMGRAIIASDLDQIGEVLAGSPKVDQLPDGPPRDADASLALLCRPGDARQLALGITFLLDRPDWRALLGKNARARALSRYTWRDHVAAILDGAAANGLTPPRPPSSDRTTVGLAPAAT